jgi:tetratricopeptide (TPR) repeat protein
MSLEDRGPLRALTAMVLAIAVLVGPDPVRAQTVLPLHIPTAEENVGRGDALHRAQRPLQALNAYQAAAASDPAGGVAVEALWKSAREAVNVGMLTQGGQEAELPWYRLAEGFARQAIATDADSAPAHEWLAIALGRAALSEGPRTRVRMAGEVHAAALAALAADSLSPGAHHVLGQWHAEVRRLHALERFLARRLMGADVFDEASWEEAERHLLRATELAPTAVIHQVELARVFKDTGRDDLARTAAQRALDLPSVEPVDPLYKEVARALLAGLT